MAELFFNTEGKYKIEIFLKGKTVGLAEGVAAYCKKVNIALSEKCLWAIGKGDLYDVKITFNNDVVYSYFGLREVAYNNFDFVLNGEKVYQKLVLDQGFCKEGIYTMTDQEMLRDIQLSLNLGFNGARLHQKVFDPRFLYFCEKAGYMVWGEYADWGEDRSEPTKTGKFLAQWGEVLARDFNHPSIVTWCPLNEAWGDWRGEKKVRSLAFVKSVYAFTKALDCTRPCIDVSGGYHSDVTDVYDFHCYQDVSALQGYLASLDEKNELNVPLLYADDETLRYTGNEPVNLSECGGCAFAFDELQKPDEIPTINDGAVLSESSWGYGASSLSGDEFVKRYKQLIQTIFSCKKLSGFCYTQLYDVEQEKNGFYTYERTDKLTKAQKEEVKKINTSF